ncbi:MAG TPA: alkaline phosphatase family protein [Chloroflexota bacterium]|nr:alkaline phosphatase family protein [Chloroflexota bacterium]
MGADGAPAQRFVLIGMDGVGMEQLLHLIREGRCPNMKRLLEQGVYREMWGVLPTLTPPGWTTLVTGAWPSTHKVMDFNIYQPGRRIDDNAWGINTRLCRAEYLWNTLERAGKTPLLVKYEMSWPPTLSGQTGGVQVEGTGPGISNHAQIAGYHCFTVGRQEQERASADSAAVDPSALRERRRYDPVSWSGTNGSDGQAGWKHLPPSAREHLAATLTIEPLKRSHPLMKRQGEGVPVTYYALAYASSDAGYDRLRLTRSKDGNDTILEEDLRPGQWSEYWAQTFTIGGQAVEGHVQCKLVALAPDASKLELFFPQIWPVSGYTFPDEVGRELLEAVGPFRQNPGRDALGVIDDESYFECLEAHLQRLADVTIHLARTRPAWTGIFTQTHATDYANHFFIADSDPISGAPPDVVERNYRGMYRTYEACDRWIGRLMEALLDERTTFCLVSDHGGTPTTFRMTNVNQVLEQAGLLVYREGAPRGGGGEGAGGASGIDWTKTKAAGQGIVNIFVNLKGREPTGIVEPGEAYERVRRQVIEALMSYKDPQAGYCPFVFALRREDAEVANMWGELVGDVVYATLPEFDGAHGRQLPSARWGWGSQHTLFVLSGAGVKRGVHLERQVRQVDVAPTLAYLCGLPTPAHAEGRVVMEALQEPDWHLR